MLFEPASPWFAQNHRVKFATTRWERNGARALRRAVFCEEQGLFEGSDRDAIDNGAITLVATSILAGDPDRVVGTVRIYEAQPGIWWGGRLAVAPGHRRAGGLGTALIDLAVRSGHAFGCRRFLANVQAPNVAFFERLHWRRLSDLDIAGIAHSHMEADLDHYPPFADGATGFVTLNRRFG